MASSKSLPIRERVKFAVRYSARGPCMINLIMERLPAEVILTRKGQPDRRTNVGDLNAREFGKLVRQIVYEMREAGEEY